MSVHKKNRKPEDTHKLQEGCSGPVQAFFNSVKNGYHSPNFVLQYQLVNGYYINQNLMALTKNVNLAVSKDNVT